MTCDTESLETYSWSAVFTINQLNESEQGSERSATHYTRSKLMSRCSVGGASRSWWHGLSRHNLKKYLQVSQYTRQYSVLNHCTVTSGGLFTNLFSELWLTNTGLAQSVLPFAPSPSSPSCVWCHRQPSVTVGPRHRMMSLRNHTTTLTR